MNDPYNLQRFVEAQDPVIERVFAELRGGRKSSHWMWFVFPQIAGLGGSEMSRRFAIGSKEEAAAYLNHPVLGRRLGDCTRLVNQVPGASAHRIFSRPDDMKFHSSMTLFSHVAGAEPVFAEALRRYFGGNDDTRTAEQLRPG